VLKQHKKELVVKEPGNIFIQHEQNGTGIFAIFIFKYVYVSYTLVIFRNHIFSTHGSSTSFTTYDTL